MNRKTLTDKFGETLEIRMHGNGEMYVEASEDGETACAGPFTREQIVKALDEVDPDLASPDYADGGMAAAAVEKEAGRVELADDPAYWHARFCEARQERDEAVRERDELRQTRRRLLGKVDQLEVKLRNSGSSGEQPRALTAREHLQLAWEAAHVPVDGIIPAGAAYLMRANRTGRVVTPTGDWAAPVDLPASESWGERRLLDPPAQSRPEWEDAPYVWADSAQGGGRVIWKRSTSDDGRVIWSSGGTWHPSWMLTNPAPVVPEGVRVVTEEQP